MPNPSEPDRRELPHDPGQEVRRGLLAGITARLAELGIDTTYGPLEHYRDMHGGLPSGITGLICELPGTTARMQVTVVFTEAAGGDVPARVSPDGRTWVRTTRFHHDAGRDGIPAFEVTTLEDPDDGLGHSRTSALRMLTVDDQGVVDAITLWYGHRHTLRAAPPGPPGARERTRRARVARARHTAAGSPRVGDAVDTGEVPVVARPALTRDIVRVDTARLCFEFPRDRNGGYASHAVVALAGYGPDPVARGPWLVARARADALVLEIAPLIGVNQDHRWDVAPWLWTTTEPPAGWPDMPPDPVVVRQLDANDVASALVASGVSVDDDLAALLDGFPTRYLRAAQTETWVRVLYAQLSRCAPWQFTAAYRIWAAERAALGRRVTSPIPLFGLTGLNQQKRPMVALDLRDGAPYLRMVWTANNWRLPYPLWRRPTHLDG